MPPEWSDQQTGDKFAKIHLQIWEQEAKSLVQSNVRYTNYVQFLLPAPQGGLGLRV